MGEIVDLNAFRKQREEEEEAKAKAEAEAYAAEEQAEIEYMQSVLDKIMVSLGGMLTGSSTGYYTMEGQPYDYYPTGGYSEFNTYYHEAGYDNDGYYERSWGPEDEEDEEDF
jgi:hypothetical protein